MGEPGFEKPTAETPYGRLKIGNGKNTWTELAYTENGAGLDYILVLDALPNTGIKNQLYRINNDFYIWNGSSFEFLIKSDIDIIDKLPETGTENTLYRIGKIFYFWSEKDQKFDILNKIPQQKNYIALVNELPTNPIADVIYKINTSQKLYHYNLNTNKFDLITIDEDVIKTLQNNQDTIISNINDLQEQDNYFKNRIIELDTLINTSMNIIKEQLNNQKIIIDNLSNNIEQLENNQDNIADILEEQDLIIREQGSKIEELQNELIDNFVTVDNLPQTAEENKLYKVKNSQLIYFWNTIKNQYEQINGIEIPEVDIKGGIEVVPTMDDLPFIGSSDMLYKVLENENVYTWNASVSEYSLIAGAGSDEPSSGNGIIVVDKYSDLPLEGEVDALYKVIEDQLFYSWNSLTNSYDKMGQSGGIIEEEGYKITLQSTIDHIFAAIKGETIKLGFRYSSVDTNGVNDGPGIGTLIVNNVKKSTVAIPQKAQELDITNYLFLGENNVQLIVTNSEGKEKTLAYSIELVDLYLTCDVKQMAIYDSETSIPFQITGSGTKKIYFLMDDEEIATDEITSTNNYKYTYRVLMQTAGAHILKIYAEREVNNMTITSNIITLGMMFVTDEMVDTHILSTFNQTKSTQGEIITIPYMVYNPHLETSDVKLTIYNEDKSIFFEKEIVVDQTVQNWVTQDYPAGNVSFEIRARSDSGIDAIKTFNLQIEESIFDLTVVNDSLALEFNAIGRSNAEKNPEQWSYEDYTGSFERFAWSGADGWVESNSGETVLRFLAGNKMTIPFYPFADDKRNTGYTIEFELESRDVTDYDSIIVSCMNGNRGFEIKSQQVIFKSALSEVSMMYKEDERVRITIVIEPTTLDRIIYMFINGIICGITQYADNDNFQQATPVPITIGSDTCGLDLYKIRFYNRALSFTEQLNNFICDRSTNAERFDYKERNDIFDISGNLTIGSLPPEIPYLVMQCEELPQYKGDKKTGKSVYFVDQLRPDRCFSASGCEFDVQGTSSAGYPIKNFKVKFKKGIVLPDGSSADGYPILENGLLSTCLCLKADYASSEQANNVMLVEYYDRLIRDYFLTPPQEEDERIRTGISARPIVLFWENTTTGEVSFWGQYNMNNDKSNENIFGFDRVKYPKLECWEFSNNTSDRCLFKKSEYEEIIYDEEKKEEYPAWTADFEARFPDTKPAYQDYTQFKRLTDWIVSTRQDTATNEILDPAIVYGTKTYTIDNAEYRLAKFKYEFDQYFIKEPILFYYLFTETFLMIDSRAKNMFLTTFDGNHWFPIPYDFDTAIGINNEGKLVFDYDLEDTDIFNNELVFNGQESTLWINVRDAFIADLFDMYDSLRTSGKFSYEIINKMMIDHQETCWPEAIWNADARKKYVDVFLKTGDNYFEMCQGNKKTQREWWLFNAFKYRDSKYRTGDAQKIIASFRAYAPDDMIIIPYQHLWPRVDYTDSYPVTQRSKRNIPNLLVCPLDNASDTEIFIRSADRISSFGDLSKYKPDTVKFASATKLQEVILGSNEEDYENHKLSSVELGTNKLLKYLNVEKCTNLSKTIDVSNCFNLETVKAFGSNLPSIVLPMGGHLKELYLPASFNDLTIRNQHMIETFEMESYENLESIWIDDTPGLPIEDLLLNSLNLSRVRIVNTTWKVSNENNLKTIFEKLKKIGGIDANNNNLNKAVMTGYVEIDSISDDFLEELNEYFTELVIIVNGKTRFFLRYVNWNNELLYKYAISQGANAIDPIENGIINEPIKEGSEDTQYYFSQWSNLPTNIQTPQTIVAMYNTQYRVQFIDGNNSIVNTQWIDSGEGAIDPAATGMINTPIKNSDAQFNYVYAHWDNTFDIIIRPTDIYAVFTSFLRKYLVRFLNGEESLQENEIYYGNTAEYFGDETEIKKKINNEPSPYYEFSHWSPDLTTPITGPTDYQAQFIFDGYIEDDWSTIISNVKNGNSDIYGYSGRKVMELTYTNQGTTYTETLELEIVDKFHDELTTVDPSYSNGSSTAGLTFRGILDLTRTVNEGVKTDDITSALNVGGWPICDIRTWLNEEFLNAFPAELRDNIKSVKKISNGGLNHHNVLEETSDKIFLPSLDELNTPNANFTPIKQGTPYILFTDNASRDIDDIYWVRSTSTLTHLWIIIDLDGRPYYSGGGNKNRVMFFFCI